MGGRTPERLEKLKRQAAGRAAELLDDVRVLGLGTGSTAEAFMEIVATRYRAGELRDLVAVPTSTRTERRARELGLPLATLESHPEVDLTVDGADEVDPDLNLIKGGGGALTREKIVAHASREVVIVVDHSKRVERLGTRVPLPVEVLRFARAPVEHALRRLGADPSLRVAGGGPFTTDEGNLILDCRFPDGIADPAALDRALNDLPGLVEHGLFLQVAHRVIVGMRSGVQVLMRDPRSA